MKCAECGFLAARNITTRELEEAEDTFREKGIPPNIIDDDGRLRPKHEQLPLCFAQRYNLRDEFKEFAGKDSADYLSVFNVLNEERECEAFRKWQQGFTPKEHMEMQREERRMNFQAEREDADRKWREEQRREDLRWREEQEEKAEKRHRWDLIILGVVATLIICIATIVAAYIERGCF